MVAVCGVCKGIASFTARTSNDEGLEVIGGADKYEPRCRMCHTYPTKKVELV
jgi:thymidine kinase